MAERVNDRGKLLSRLIVALLIIYALDIAMIAGYMLERLNFGDDVRFESIGLFGSIIALLIFAELSLQNNLSASPSNANISYYYYIALCIACPRYLCVDWDMALAQGCSVFILCFGRFAFDSDCCINTSSNRCYIFLGPVFYQSRFRCLPFSQISGWLLPLEKKWHLFR